MWEDDQNNEKRYLWYLSENGEKYLQRNLKYIHDLVWSFNVLRYGNKKEIDISHDISK